MATLELTETELTEVQKVIGRKVEGIQWVLQNKEPKNPVALSNRHSTLSSAFFKMKSLSN